MKIVLMFCIVFLLYTSNTFSDINRYRTETNKGANGFSFTSHTHTLGEWCKINCDGPGYSPCPDCGLSIISSGSNNDLSLHNYAKQQIIQGNLTGNQVSSDGLWKVKWEKKQNNDLSIVAWELSGQEPPLWP